MNSDSLDTLIIDDFDYSPVVEIATKPGVVLVDWDIAVDRSQAEWFEASCLADLATPRVAPYRIYETNSNHWVHWRLPHRWVHRGESHCDGFGFGLTYIPYDLLKMWEPEYSDKRMTDTNFSSWYIRKGGGPVPIEWGVRPVHLRNLI